MKIDKSLITNLLALLTIFIGHLVPFYKDQILSIGYFALSGAITNWLAIHMLFEKVPGLYGSGVIPNRFQDFKKGIHGLIMGQFFTKENMDKFFKEQKNSLFESLDISPLIENLDYKKFFNSLIETIEQSSFGPMLMMVGGTTALEPMREPFTEKMKSTILEFTKTEDFINGLNQGPQKEEIKDDVLKKVELIVQKRLDELTPQMVKKIIQDMIKKHLGWLVVWGGVFGALIGLGMSFTL
jgi:uncharacterized membrane protein YheB (UPF0754 family)